MADDQGDWNSNGRERLSLRDAHGLLTVSERPPGPGVGRPAVLRHVVHLHLHPDATAQPDRLERNASPDPSMVRVQQTYVQGYRGANWGYPFF